MGQSNHYYKVMLPKILKNKFEFQVPEIGKECLKVIFSLLLLWNYKFGI